jgi:signal transduction histidine kinase
MSLKWRIAIGYAVLLWLVLAVTSGIIVWRFQEILYDQAKSTANATMQTIVQVAEQSTSPLSLDYNPRDPLRFLFNSTNLASWSSASTFVQVDSAEGYPLAKTRNLGGSTIPPNPALSRRHAFDYRTVSMNGRPFLVEDRYLRAGQDSAVIHVAEPLDTLLRTFARARTTIEIVLAAAAVAVVALSILLASGATTPINQLSQAMREIGSERLERRLKWPPRKDEIGKLAESFDDLLHRLAQAFARERQFISDASHELKTPLTSINANAQMLLRWGDRDPEILRESLETIAKESAMLAEMVNGMLMLAKADRGDEMPKEPVSLAQIASEVTQHAVPRAASKGLDLRFQHDGLPVVLGDPGLLRQLVGNLVDNAIKFSDGDGRGHVLVRVGSNADEAWLEVADDGPGIPDAELPHVFDRFYRADKARSRAVPGTGLGLAIVRSIAEAHHGSVKAGKAPGGGALFRVSLPRFTDLQ